MKYYSDVTKKFYDTAVECQTAELKEQERLSREKAEKERTLAEKKAKEEKIAAERKSRAAELEEARKAMVAAQKKYRDLIEAFTKDYGSYHYTSNSVEDIPTLFSLFDWFNI